MINRPLVREKMRNLLPLPEAHFRTTNEMLDDFCLFRKDLAYEIVVTNTQAMADQIEEVEVVKKKDCNTFFIDRAEEQVAEMTYARAFELYGNPLPDIIDLRIERVVFNSGNGFAVIYLASQMLVNRSNERGYLVGSRGSVGSSFLLR